MGTWMTKGLADAKGETMVILHDGTASEEGRNYYVDAALQDAMEILQIDSRNPIERQGYGLYGHGQRHPKPV